jgi:hypothetical protein
MLGAALSRYWNLGCGEISERGLREGNSVYSCAPAQGIDGAGATNAVGAGTAGVELRAIIIPVKQGGPANQMASDRSAVALMMVG